MNNFKSISDYNKYLPLLKCNGFEKIAGFALTSNSIESITPSTKMFKLEYNAEYMSIDDSTIKIKCFVIFNNSKVICYSNQFLKGLYKEFVGYFNTNSEYFNFKEYSDIQMPIKSIKIKTLNKIEYLVSPAIDYRYRNQMLPVREHTKNDENTFNSHPSFFSREECIEKCTIDPTCHYIITNNIDSDDKNNKCYHNDTSDIFSKYFMKIKIKNLFLKMQILILFKKFRKIMKI